MDNTYTVKILAVTPLTHDVRQFKVEKPEGYTFIPGQATEISLPLAKDDRHPFTFTGLNEWDHLEFSIKIYPERHGITDRLGHLKPGDELILHDVWGAIQYKGPGTFIAGGAGITPFIAIFRQLHQDGALPGNQLLFANKTVRDIILRDTWDEWLGKNVHYVLSKEKAPGCAFGRIDAAYLKDRLAGFDGHFYVCGPDQMVTDVRQALESLGAATDLVTVEV